MAAPLVPNWQAKARRAAKKYGLDPGIFVRQINAESGGRNYGANHAGARGIAQFVPGTAASMGVDPMNPDQALDGAARLMARMVKKYGSYEKALRGYNAGEGAIERSRGFAETNNYVKKILGGRDPGKLGKADPSAKESRTGGGSRTTTTTSQVPIITEQFDQAGYEKAQRQVSLKNFLQQSGGKWGLLTSLLPDQADPAAFTRQAVENQTVTRTSTTSSPKARRRSSTPSSGGGGPLPGLKGRGGTLKELFYDPIGGFKNQQSIGAIGKHGNHVHAAGSGPKATRALGELAERMGLTVRENENWDKVDPVHVANSNHYRFGGRGAIDVSGDAKKMAAFTRQVMRIYGVRR